MQHECLKEQATLLGFPALSPFKERRQGREHRYSFIQIINRSKGRYGSIHMLLELMGVSCGGVPVAKCFHLIVLQVLEG